jgi:hypothetical protein
VRVPLEVAEALVREEMGRRRVAEEKKVSARIVDAVKGVAVQQHKPEFELPPAWNHVPRVEFAKGKVTVTCNCGVRVCHLPRADKDAVERAWFTHRDGTPGWKKA